MRIGILTTSFPRWEHDVAGTFVLGFARSLAERGHSVEVLAPEPSERVELPRWDGIEVRWVPYLRPRALEKTFYGAGAPENLVRDPRAWLGPLPFTVALLREVRKRAAGWDAIVTHWAMPSALVAAASKRRPHLAVFHSADVHLLTRVPGGRRLAGRIARGADALLFSSPAMRDAFTSLLPARLRADVAGRSHVSAMGIDVPPRVDRRRARKELGLDRFTVLSMGRLVPIKGIDDAVEAIARLGDDAELVVAGEGPERRRLEKLAAKTGARARFVGNVSGARKAALLGASDAFVVPSRELALGRTEGTPTAMLEAMSAGLAVVASDVGGIPSIITHERTGLLVAPGTPGALCDALARLRDDVALRRRLSRSGRNVAKHYAWSEIAPHIEALLVTP